MNTGGKHAYLNRRQTRDLIILFSCSCSNVWKRSTPLRFHEKEGKKTAKKLALNLEKGVRMIDDGSSEEEMLVCC